MNEELLKKKYFAEGNYMLIYHGTSKSVGGMLISPFHDSILENAWLELNNFDKREGDFLVVKIEEDTVEYFEDYKRIKIYNEIREHCYKVLGKEYFG